MSIVPRSRSADRRYYGAVVALVTDNVDPEGAGRIEIRFPWFNDPHARSWCRLCQPYGGQDYGAFFIPEVGAEVLVAFHHGDMAEPFVIGSLYNGVDTPPSRREQARDQKMFRTRAGHEFLLDDSDEARRVRLTTQGGHVLDLDDKGRAATLTTAGGHALTLDDQGSKASLVTSGGHSVVMDDAGQRITIQAGGVTVTLDGSGQATIQGASITLDAADVRLGGQGAAEPLILGLQFMTLFNAHTHLCTAPTTPSGPPLPLMTPAALSTTTKAL